MSQERESLKTVHVERSHQHGHDLNLLHVLAFKCSGFGNVGTACSMHRSAPVEEQQVEARKVSNCDSEASLWPPR
ncbi:unnamed protein product [Sphagnum compactum]